MTDARYFAAISTVTFSNGTKAPFVTGGYNDFNTSLSTTEMFTSSGWNYSTPLPVNFTSHAQVTMNNKVFKFDASCIA